MTKDEIKALISAKVAGQGDQVDAGGALTEILNGIIDAIPEGGGGAAILPSSISSAASIENLDSSTKALVAERLGVSAADIDDIATGKYAYIGFSEGQNLYPIRVITNGASVWIYISDASLADNVQIKVTSQDGETWSITVRV